MAKLFRWEPKVVDLFGGLMLMTGDSISSHFHIAWEGKRFISSWEKLSFLWRFWQFKYFDEAPEYNSAIEVSAARNFNDTLF